MEKQAKIAYLIAAHADPAHLARMVYMLDHHADFFIHIDRKQAIEPFTDRINGPNIYFLTGRDRVTVHWGGFSQVRATLNLMSRCLAVNKRNTIPYKKVVFMSGADYPIKPAEYIHHYFDEHREVNFIRGMNITRANAKKYNYCVSNYLFFDFHTFSSTLTRIIRKVLNVGVNRVAGKPNYASERGGGRIELYHASSWWALNVEVIRYICRYAEEHPELSRYFRYSLASDEKFFHTIFFNSRYATTNLFGGAEPFVPMTAAFANLHIIDPSLQKWFGVNDLEHVIASDKLFVRKVSTRHSTELLDRIDRILLQEPQVIER